MNAALPTRCPSRTELQTLVLRTDQASLDANSDELAALLRALSCAAANLEGYLSEQAPQKHPTDKLLENPNNWQSQWMTGSFVIHDAPDDLAIRHGQQILMTPGGAHLPTGRYMLQLGEAEPYKGCDVGLLRAAAESYLAKHPNVDPLSVTRTLDHLFPAAK